MQNFVTFLSLRLKKNPTKQWLRWSKHQVIPTTWTFLFELIWFCTVKPPWIKSSQHCHNPPHPPPKKIHDNMWKQTAWERKEITDCLSVRDLSAFQQTDPAFSHSHCLSTKSVSAHTRQITTRQFSNSLRECMCSCVHVCLCMPDMWRSEKKGLLLSASVTLWLANSDWNDLFDTGRQCGKYTRLVLKL